MAHLNNDKEESLSEPLKKMSQDYKTVYKEMAECLLKGALAELGTITDKTNKIKYVHPLLIIFKLTLNYYFSQILNQCLPQC